MGRRAKANWLAVVSGVLACAVVSACGPSDASEPVSDSATIEPATTVPTPVTPKGSEPTTLATAPNSPTTTSSLASERPVVEWRELAADTSPADFAVPPAGVLTLDHCRWRSGVEYSFDLTWTPVDGADMPAVLPLELILALGDQGTGVRGEATVTRPGPFTVDVVIRSTANGRWWARRPDERLDGDWAANVGCVAETVLGERAENFVSLDADPRPAIGAGEAHDSIEGVSASIGLLDDSEPLLPLAWLFADPEPPLIDHLYVNPVVPMSVIEAEVDGTCWKIRSLYRGETFPTDAVVEVEQRVGCAPGFPSDDEWVTVAVADDVWDIAVRGPANLAPEFAEQLTVLWSERVTPFDQSAVFDSDRYFDEQIAMEGWSELRRFDWAGGRVPTAIEGEDLLGMQVMTVIPDGFNGGSSATPCRAFATFETSDEEGRGFVVVAVVGSRTASIDEDGDGPGGAVPIPLEPSLVDDITVGLYEHSPPMMMFNPEQISIRDADGSPTECVQWDNVESQPGTTTP